ncbi:hypothetical protein [Paraliomyxa miuraensis]|uniref:hypothetical protein n=1 Tax=Paraliomyxa miuraensis TaxID=376150 RepID=UPI0022523547|nr:hypothetical protein [Paraliomyxa miuraensis]MCX4239981.1 hypothetical protein [Paraliomyxa miuraensis]
MPRRFHWVRPLHTLDFSPLQLHPTMVLSLTIEALATCIRGQLCDWRVLVEQHRWSTVIVGFDVRWLRPFTFFDASRLELDCGMRTRKDDQLLEVQLELRPESEDERVVSASLLCRPVEVTGGAALDARPAPMRGAPLAMLRDDEREPSAPGRVVPQREALVSSGSLVAERITDFEISRDECEVADQWRFSVLPALAGRAREALAMEGGDPRVRHGLSRALASTTAELRRPMYLREAGQVRTRVYEHEGSLAYVHHIHGAPLGPGPDAERPLCATVIEQLRA